MKFALNYKKIMIVALLTLLAVISITKIAPAAADPANHKHSIEQTEEKIASVMTLSGGAAATSATLSLLPGDMCTPLAEQLAELAKYFLISLSGYISFMILIPLACLFVCIAVVAGKQNLTRTAVKIALIGVIIFGIVPASVKLSDMVYQTQASKVNDAIDDYNNLEIEGDAESGLFNEFSTITTETIENVSSFMDNLLESLAVMIVTSCVIPLLVFFFLVWLVKIVFSANILVLDTTSLEALAKRPLG